MAKVYQDWNDTTHEVVEVVRCWNGWAVPRVTVDQAESMGVFDQEMSSFLVATAEAGVYRLIGQELPEEAEIVRAESDGTIVLDFGWTYFEEEEPAPEGDTFYVRSIWEGELLDRRDFTSMVLASAYFNSSVDRWNRSDDSEGITVQMIDSATDDVVWERYIAE